MSVTVTVRNTGTRAGADVPQAYLQTIDGALEPRLLAFRRVELSPGEQTTITMDVAPRLLARYDTADRRWQIKGGRYVVAGGQVWDTTGAYPRRDAWKTHLEAMTNGPPAIFLRRSTRRPDS